GGGIVTSESDNQSLPGLVVRLLTHSPSFTSWDKDLVVYTPLQYDNYFSLSLQEAGWIVKGCMAAFSLAVVWLCRTPTAQPQNWRLASEFAVIILGMLLFSERTWKHHCVTLILPFACVLYALANLELSRLTRRYLIATLVLSALLMASASIS